MAFTLILSPQYALADLTYSGSKGLANGDWIAFPFYCSEGDKLAGSWQVTSIPESVDVWVMNGGNYSFFLNGTSFEKVLTMNNSFQDYFLLEGLPEDLYFTVFYSDQQFGFNFDYQLMLIEKEFPDSFECNCSFDFNFTCDCNCTCNYVDNTPDPATITGISTLAFGLIAVITIIAIIWKTKVKKLN